MSWPACGRDGQKATCTTGVVVQNIENLHPCAVMNCGAIATSNRRQVRGDSLTGAGIGYCSYRELCHGDNQACVVELEVKVAWSFNRQGLRRYGICEES